MPVSRVMGEAKGVLPVSDIYCLLVYVLDRGREFILANPDYKLTKDELARWKECVYRRKKGEPCAYITGRKEFYSLLFEVDRHTLIPRPETELLVDEVIKSRPKSLLDLGTGCGNIAVAVKYHLSDCSVVASDVSPEALRVAGRNADKILGAYAIELVLSSYFRDMDAAVYDVIASNPPYVKRTDLETLQREIREHEPLIALDGGEDGLDAYRSILGGGAEFLAEQGKIMLEIDGRLLGVIRSLAEENGYIIEKIEKDLSGKDRVVVLGKR